MPDTQTPILSAVGLQKTYGTRRVLHDLSFSLHAGRVMGFLGPNGAGKTTTIRILTTILRPSAGSFFVDGISGENPGAIRRIIGVLPESQGFPERMTALEYLVYGARLYGIPRRIAREKSAVLLADVGLASRSRSLVSTFSRGMRQRMGIARALVNDPKLVFLDEPTLGLDPKGQRELLHLIRRIARERNASVVLCSHLLAEIEEVCDDVIILNAGQMVASGSVAEVLSRSDGQVLRLRVEPERATAAACIVGALPSIRHVSAATSANGSLNIQTVDDPGTDFRALHNQILESLIRAEIPVLSFGSENGRLQDVFLKLTESAPQ